MAPIKLKGKHTGARIHHRSDASSVSISLINMSLYIETRYCKNPPASVYRRYCLAAVISHRIGWRHWRRRHPLIPSGLERHQARRAYCTCMQSRANTMLRHRVPPPIDASCPPNNPCSWTCARETPNATNQPWRTSYVSARWSRYLNLHIYQTRSKLAPCLYTSIIINQVGQAKHLYIIPVLVGISGEEEPPSRSFWPTSSSILLWCSISRTC